MKNHSTHLAKIAQTLCETSFPNQISLEITAHCNLRCSMCYNYGMKRSKGEMPFELFKRCADQIQVASPDTQIWFSFNGEPLLVPDRLLQMIIYAKSVGLRSLNLNTNGMLLSNELIKPLLESGLNSIVFGIDGFSRETYERIRIGAHRDRVYANVERCLKERQSMLSGPEIMVQFIEMDENIHELEAFKAYWLDRGAIVKARRKLSWGGTIKTPLTLSADKRIPCPWIINLMHVVWDGRITRCPGDFECMDSVGNAWDEPLIVLWKRLGLYRKLHLNGFFDQLPKPCESCKDWMVGAAEKIRPKWGPFATPSETDVQTPVDLKTRERSY
jgi:pyruvate-formate lyase-activating enzyme